MFVPVYSIKKIAICNNEAVDKFTNGYRQMKGIWREYTCAYSKFSCIV